MPASKACSVGECPPAPAMAAASDAASITMMVMSSHTGPAALKVYSTIGVQGAIEALVPQFEQASGHRLLITWATAPMLVRRLQGGETTDVMILNSAGIDTMTREGRIAA